MSDRIHKLAEQVIAGVQDYVRRSLAGVGEQIKALEQRLSEIPAGPAGADGAPGQKGDTGERGERGADGAHGKDGERGEKGERGEPGEKGERGERGEQGPAGEPGQRGEKGEPGIQGERGEPGQMGQKGDEGLPGRDGMPGEPGRDAVHVEVLDGIDPAKKYQRGTFAAYRGGIVRSFKATEPLPADGDLERAGWHVVVRGLADAELALSEDLRTVTLRLAYTGGEKVEKAVRSPAIIYRGIWVEGTYSQGDAVTRDGSTWIAKSDTETVPGADGSAWQLAVKRGRDGRDGVKGEKGDRGAEGRAGRDLTQMTLDGRRF